MKFTPIPSTSPRVLRHESVATESPPYEAEAEMVNDPLRGQFIILGLCTSKRTTRAWLTKEQAQDYAHKLLNLIFAME